MSNKQGLVNFSKNIEPIMLKCKGGKKLTKEEQLEIMEYYLEVLHYLAFNQHQSKEVN